MKMEVTIELVGKNQQWILDQPVIKIGRDPSCEVHLGDDCVMVSRVHASLVVEDGNCFVEDTNSPNGTFLQGKRVQRARLNPADVIRLGKDGPELKVRFIPQADPAVVPQTIAGPAKQPRSFAHTIFPKKAAPPAEAPAGTSADMMVLEQQLQGLRKLLSITLGAIVILIAVIVYQGYTISRTQDTVLQMRREATDAVSQFAPALDQKLKDFEKRADDMQSVVTGFDAKIKKAEDEFAERMQKEVPATMDRYIQSKLDEVRGGRRPGSK